MYIKPVRCRIPDILRKKRKTQVWLSEQLGMTRQSLNAYIHLRSVLGMELGKNIAEILDVTMDDLYEWDWHGE